MRTRFISGVQRFCEKGHKLAFNTWFDVIETIEDPDYKYPRSIIKCPNCGHLGPVVKEWGEVE